MSVARPALSSLQRGRTRSIVALAVVTLLTVGVTGCKRKLPQQPGAEAAMPATNAASAAPAPTSTPASAAAQPASEPASEPQLVNVAGLSQGAFVVNKPRDNYGWIAMLNEVPDSVGVTANGDRYETVIALAAPATIRALRFDRIAELGAALHAEVQVSEQSQDGPWQTVYDADLTPFKDNTSKTIATSITLKKPVAARWLRMAVSGRSGGAGSSTISLQQFAALGEFQSEPKARDVSGIYDFGRAFDGAYFVAMKQDGATVRGCYGEGDFSGGRLKVHKITGTFDGGLEPNGYLRYARHGSKEAWRGVVSFSPDGNQGAMLEFPATVSPQQASIRDSVDSTGRKIATYQNTCPGLDQNPVSSALEQDKRVTLYGVNFDLDADTLRADSRPALDTVAKAAKAHPDWKLTIEGHTDSSGGDAHNQDLSQRRAASVRQYLIDAGIPGDRLTAQGFGAGRPVAPNTTPAGRAQNRRVEVARQ